MTLRSTKRYGHEVGLSCAFRQHRADSHCRHVHGYALAVKFTFEAEEPDVRGWVVDFGSLKSLKGWLEDTFDHALVVASDDPALDDFRSLHDRDVVRLVILPAVGCEAFARTIGEAAEVWLADNGYAPRVRLVEVEVAEHGANSAIWRPDA